MFGKADETSHHPLLQRWSLPPDYAGETYEDYYVGPSRTRDSDILEEVNFEAALERLGGESDDVIVDHASHFGFGWVETILVHKDATSKLDILEDIYRALADYPILDESRYSKARTEEINEFAERYGIDEVRKALGLEYTKLTKAQENVLLGIASKLVSEYEKKRGGLGITSDIGAIREAAFSDEPGFAVLNAIPDFWANRKAEEILGLDTEDMSPAVFDEFLGVIEETLDYTSGSALYEDDLRRIYRRRLGTGSPRGTTPLFKGRRNS